jgi:methionine--tRNA ligase beta chain
MLNEDGFAPAPVKKIVAPEDVEKLDVRVGTIERVEDMPKSEKLLKLTVNFGDHKRRILVGMKGERSDPAGEMIGRQALFVVNVAPKKMVGELSEGMPFDIGYADGLSSVLAVPEKRVPNGARAG